ncbi:MAG: hypothetical protein JO077_00115 [Verrucomicrobia bacterium]|nr:hypothetical protein [Verrucomicrobiota bacterium]
MRYNLKPDLRAELHRKPSSLFSTNGRFWQLEYREIGYAIFWIALFLLIANYLFANDFGIYEDDYIWVMTLPPMHWNFLHALGEIKSTWPNWVTYYQGRPLGFSLNILMAFFSGKLPSLVWGYAVGYGIFLTNAILLFVFARRFMPWAGALVAALCYLIFPPDASKVILMHRHLHLSMTFLMVALLLYQRDKLVWAYLVSALCLITYEAFYLPFVAAPLLTGVPMKKPVAKAAIHLLIFFVTAGVVLGLRSQGGDDRSALLTGGISANLPKILEAVIIGPWTCLRWSFFGAPLRGLNEGAWPALVLAILVGGALFVVLRRAAVPAAGALAEGGKSLFRRRLVVGLGAVIAMAFAYCLAFRDTYFPPVTVEGRLSGVHVGAALGFSLLVGIVFTILTETLRKRTAIICCLTTFYLALWINYGVTVQKHYMADWAEQADFWKRLITLSGSFSEGDIILIDFSNLPWRNRADIEPSIGTKGFDALSYFVAFPKSWGHDPRVFEVDARTPADVVPNGLKIHTPDWFGPDTWPVISDGKFFYVKFYGNELHVVDTPIVLSGHIVRPKHLVSPLPVPYANTGIFRKVFHD